MSNKFAVLGLGHWGTALAQHLASLGNEVTGWTIGEEVANGINANHRNPNYLQDVALSENITATTNLEEATKSATHILSVIPAAFLAETFTKLTLKDNQILVSATKGLDPKTLKSPIDLAKDAFGSVDNFAVLSGPGFAKEIARGLPAGITIAANDIELAKSLAEIFSGNNLKFYYSDDLIGVEIGGVVKNIIAIVAGMSDGMELGDSARAGMITRGLTEMQKLAVKLGARPETIYGLSGLGDLVLTATSTTSRNYQVGLALGTGKNLEEAKTQAGSTAEGILATYAVSKLAKQHQIDMPITTALLAVLEDHKKPAEILTGLINRDLKQEF